MLNVSREEGPHNSMPYRSVRCQVKLAKASLIIKRAIAPMEIVGGDFNSIQHCRNHGICQVSQRIHNITQYVIDLSRICFSTYVKSILAATEKNTN